MALSTKLFFSIGFIANGNVRPVRLERVSNVGSSKSLGCGELFLSQSMALSKAFCLAASGEVALGIGTPVSIARESTVGPSKFW